MFWWLHTFIETQNDRHLLNANITKAILFENKIMYYCVLEKHRLQIRNNEKRVHSSENASKGSCCMKMKSKQSKATRPVKNLYLYDYY